MMEVGRGRAFGKERVGGGGGGGRKRTLVMDKIQRR